MYIRKLNLRARSVLCFGALCALMVLLGLFALRQAAVLNEAESYLETNVLPSVNALNAMALDLTAIRGNNARLRNPNESAAFRQSVRADVDVLAAAMVENGKTLSSLIVTPRGKALFAEFQSKHDSFRASQARFLALIDKEDYVSAMAYAGQDHRKAADELGQTLKALISVNDEKARNAGITARAAYSSTVLWVSVLLLAAFVAAVVLGLIYTRSVAQPMNEALHIAERIAANDFTQRIDVSGTDEAARLVAAMARMQASLRDALTVIADSSTQLATTSEEMHAVTEDSAKGMQRQNDEIEMAATAVNEMSAAVDEVASNAASASQAAATSSTTAFSGRSRVEETVTAINEMVASVGSTSNEVKGLAERATGISKVLDVIRAIAEQTNLLALNAAIEAARAGEAGRGFAVVADEVRALAHRTQESTREIEQMINAIQSGTESAVSSMLHTSGQAQRTLDLAQAAGQALAEITDSIAQINERNLLIATAAEEQAQVAREVDRSLTSIRDLAVQSAAGSHQTSVASGELSSLAVDLNRLVKRFSF